MSDANFKIIKDFGNPRKSERRKYLETMMADMGLTSLDELSPEEQKRWIKATRPDPMVEKKLKEMGYSIHADTNKRSLGRNCKIIKLYKIANISLAASEYSDALRDLKTIFDPEILTEIINTIDPNLQDKNFDEVKIRTEVDSILEESLTSSSFNGYFIDSLMERASLYNSEYLRSTGAFEDVDISSFEDTEVSKPKDIDLSNIEKPTDIGSGFQMRRGHKNRDQVAFIQKSLVDLKYPLEYFGVDGKFGPETETAVILFQEQNDLPVTGVVDDAMFNKLTGDPKPLSDELVEKYKKINFDNISLTSSRVDLVRADPMLREYLNILDGVAGKTGSKIKITSAFRGPYDQARIMYNNYKNRGVGTSRANSYLERLYRNFPDVDKIVNVFKKKHKEETEEIRKQKISDAKDIIAGSWRRKGHLGGTSIDISFSGTNVKDALVESQRLATVDILRESDHFHVTIKSLQPEGIPSGKMRIFA